jgi:hypothetical protein
MQNFLHIVLGVLKGTYPALRNFVSVKGLCLVYVFGYLMVEAHSSVA